MFHSTLFTGGQGQDKSSRLDSILSYDPHTDSWQPAGTMTVPRSKLAIAVYQDLASSARDDQEEGGGERFSF